MQLPISILPGDARMEYTAEAMAKKGGIICSSWSEIPASGYVICGIPFTKDGKMVNTSMPDSISIRSFLGMLTSSHIIIGGNLPKRRHFLLHLSRHKILRRHVIGFFCRPKRPPDCRGAFDPAVVKNFLFHLRLPRAPDRLRKLRAGDC